MMTNTVQQPVVTATVHTRLLATPMGILRAPGLTGGQREARHLLACRIEDLRYELAQPAPDLEDAATQLLEAMAGCDDADARAARGYPR